LRFTVLFYNGIYKVKVTFN